MIGTLLVGIALGLPSGITRQLLLRLHSIDPPLNPPSSPESHWTEWALGIVALVAMVVVLAYWLSKLVVAQGRPVPVRSLAPASNPGTDSRCHRGSNLVQIRTAINLIGKSAQSGDSVGSGRRITARAGPGRPSGPHGSRWAWSHRRATSANRGSCARPASPTRSSQRPVCRNLR